MWQKLLESISFKAKILAELEEMRKQIEGLRKNVDTLNDTIHDDLLKESQSLPDIK